MAMLISISQAAELLGIGRSTAYRLAKTGKLPCVRGFGPLRIHRQMLLDQIANEAEGVSSDHLPGRESLGRVRPGGTELHRTPNQIERELDRLLASKPKRKVANTEQTG